MFLTNYDGEGTVLIAQKINICIRLRENHEFSKIGHRGTGAQSHQPMSFFSSMLVLYPSEKYTHVVLKISVVA